MSLRVLDPGLYTLVVDAGRLHSRSLGVPVGGAADRTALALGNGLVANPPAAAALEVCLRGPTLQADVQVACVLYGAPFAVTIIKAGFSERPDFREVPTGKTFTLDAGDQVHIGAAINGMRAYFCVAGGLRTAAILDSRSAFEPMHVGSELPCSASKIHTRSLPRFISSAGADDGSRDPRTRISDMLARDWPASTDAARTLRVLDGLQVDWFSQAEFYDQQFAVTPASNRMGLRLQGRPLTLPNRELVSEAVCPGAVQVTSDGQCIVLGVDGQTIGGYPKIAQVIGADLDRLGQLRPGERIRFVRVTLEEAIELQRRREEELRCWGMRLRTSFDAIS
jgi:5-oxoprolinase (ATP-hydrolysing) subunit C